MDDVKQIVVGVVERTPLKLPVPVSEIWALLYDYPGGSDPPPKPSWAECLSKARRTTRGDVIGELHLKEDARASDFERIPTGRSLIVVMLAQEEEFILRWLNEKPWEDVAEILGGPGHANMVRHGDDYEEAPRRKGYMTVHDAGHTEF